MAFIYLFPEWAEPRDETYSLSNENKTVTRTNEGLTHIIYSHKPSLTLGNTLTMKVLDDADKSPGDGLFIALQNDTVDGFIQEDVIYVNLYGRSLVWSYSIFCFALNKLS